MNCKLALGNLNGNETLNILKLKNLKFKIVRGIYLEYISPFEFYLKNIF